MSINGPKFQSVQTELVRFVLNKELKHLPSHVRLFAFYSIGDRSRSSGVSGMMQGVGTESFTGFVFSEILFRRSALFCPLILRLRTIDLPTLRILRTNSPTTKSELCGFNCQYCRFIPSSLETIATGIPYLRRAKGISHNRSDSGADTRVAGVLGKNSMTGRVYVKGNRL